MDLILVTYAVYQYINSSWQQLGADIDGEAEVDNLVGPSHSQRWQHRWRLVRMATTAMDLAQVMCASTNTSAQAGSSSEPTSTVRHSGDSLAGPSPSPTDGSAVAIGAPANDGNGSDSVTCASTNSHRNPNPHKSHTLAPRQLHTAYHASCSGSICTPRYGVSQSLC